MNGMVSTEAADLFVASITCILSEEGPPLSRNGLRMSSYHAQAGMACMGLQRMSSPQYISLFQGDWFHRGVGVGGTSLRIL